jgi:antirestriction protein ArdC
VLKDDKRAIFTAAAHAQRAADFLHGLQAPALVPERPAVRQPAMRISHSDGSAGASLMTG